MNFIIHINSSHVNFALLLKYRADVTPEMWRFGKVLRPYYEDVKLIVQNKANYHQLATSAIKVVELGDLSFEHCPIVDCGITDDDRVLDLCRKLVADIARGEVIYLHCWGGHGRTGTVVSIMLHLMYGVSTLTHTHNTSTLRLNCADCARSFHSSAGRRRSHVSLPVGPRPEGLPR